MRNSIIILFFLLITFSCNYKREEKTRNLTKINIDLKRRLDLIFLKDQGIRELMNSKTTPERRVELFDTLKLSEADFEKNKIKIMQHWDSLNLVEVEKIIDEYGYPGKDLVGEPTNKTAFYVIQHSSKIGEHLPLIRKVGENGEIGMTKIAMMEDRYLMRQDKEQIYGTQIKGIKQKGGEWVHFVWPIKNPDSVNYLRQEIGFNETIEEYAKKFDIEYKLYTIDDVKNLQK